METVLEALREERISLVESQTDRIESTARTKDQTLTRLMSLRQQRDLLVSEAGADNLATLVSGLDGNSECQRLLARLQALGGECEALNNANGLLIAGLSERTRQALQILRQGSLNPGLYSGTGATETSSDRLSLGRA